MTMFSRLSRYRFYDPDDAGGQGDPAADGTPATPETPPTPPPVADLKAVADSIRAAILESRTPVAAAPVAAVGVSDATRRALEEESVQVNARFDELVNSGKAAEAMAVREQFIQKANRLMAPAQSDNTMVRTAVAVGERLAKSEHKDVMSRWGDEVKRTVDAMPVEDRVSPDAWDRAVAQVKTAHFSELLEEQTTARVEAAKKTFAPPPVMPGARGSRALSGAAAKLSEEQIWGADLCGVEPAKYAEELARETAYDALPFKERGPFPGYPILSDKIVPGGF